MKISYYSTDTGPGELELSAKAYDDLWDHIPNEECYNKGLQELSGKPTFLGSLLTNRARSAEVIAPVPSEHGEP